MTPAGSIWSPTFSISRTTVTRSSFETQSDQIATERTLADTIAVVGVGTTAQGELPGRTANDIAVEALRARARRRRARQARARRADHLQGVRHRRRHRHPDRRPRRARPRYSATLDYGTCNFSLHLAAMAMRPAWPPRSPSCTAPTSAAPAALRRGGRQRRAGTARAVRLPQHRRPRRAGGAARIDLYGLTEEHLGHVAVAQRANAPLNPLAVFRDPLTHRRLPGAPYLVEPLRRADLCMISDGGACLIVTARERAATSHRPVYLLAGAQQAAALPERAGQLLRPWARPAADRLWAASGLSRATSTC